MNEATIKGFADLFRGGKVAIDTGEFRPWTNHDGTFVEAQGEEYENKIADHLKAEPAIGVYPLFAEEDGLKVYWGCVDWDESWIERSRSKGFHLWVFFTAPMYAKEIREGLIGACQIVDAPTKEVNPKQVELSQRGWGNGVRLPYAGNRQRGGYNEMDRPEYSFSMVPVKSFVKEAIKTRITPDCWKPVRALYKPPKPFMPDNTSHTPTGPLRGLAGAIRKNGPRSTETLPKGDRSATLFSLACQMIRQRYPHNSIFNELKSADREWGGKYDSRQDGDTQLWRIISASEKVAWENEETYQRNYREKTKSQGTP